MKRDWFHRNSHGIRHPQIWLQWGSMRNCSVLRRLEVQVRTYMYLCIGMVCFVRCRTETMTLTSRFNAFNEFKVKEFRCFHSFGIRTAFCLFSILQIRLCIFVLFFASSTIKWRSDVMWILNTQWSWMRSKFEIQTNFGDDWWIGDFEPQIQTFFSYKTISDFFLSYCYYWDYDGQEPLCSITNYCLTLSVFPSIFATKNCLFSRSVCCYLIFFAISRILS